MLPQFKTKGKPSKAEETQFFVTSSIYIFGQKRVVKNTISSLHGEATILCQWWSAISICLRNPARRYYVGLNCQKKVHFIWPDKMTCVFQEFAILTSGFWVTNILVCKWTLFVWQRGHEWCPHVAVWTEMCAKLKKKKNKNAFQ